MACLQVAISHCETITRGAPAESSASTEGKVLSRPSLSAGRHCILLKATAMTLQTSFCPHRPKSRARNTKRRRRRRQRQKPTAREWDLSRDIRKILVIYINTLVTPLSWEESSRRVVIVDNAQWGDQGGTATAIFTHHHLHG